MKAACRISVFLLNYFFKCQISDHVNGLTENKAIYFGFLGSCYISWQLTFISFGENFFFDNTCIIVPLFSYTPNVPKNLNRVDVHNRVEFSFPAGMLYSEMADLTW